MSDAYDPATGSEVGEGDDEEAGANDCTETPEAFVGIRENPEGALVGRGTKTELALEGAEEKPEGALVGI